MVAVGVIIFPSSRDILCFPVPHAPTHLRFFLKPAPVSPGGLCRGHCILDEAPDGVPWGPISALINQPDGVCPDPAAAGLLWRGWLPLHAEGTTLPKIRSKHWDMKKQEWTGWNQWWFRVKTIVLKPNCSISHPVKFYELDASGVSIKKWQCGIVQLVEPKMQGNGLSNNHWIQTPSESKKWGNNFAPRGWRRHRTLIIICSYFEEI